MTGLRYLSILALVAGQVVPAFAAGDADEGHALARQWCSACHIVDEEQTTGSADVPPFAAIARSESLTADGLAAFLANPHPVMPNLSLSRAEIADIVAYIEALKRD
ncbi:c-type cytochrome [Amorphus sp. MBR-141]